MPGKEKKKYPSRVHDIYVRLPVKKRYLKKEMKKIAEEYNLPVNTIMVDAIEYYLRRRKKRTFTI